MEGVIGFTTGFAGNFAPKNWAFCQGQTINIASNTALFSILGTTYGGNGTTTFALPDLQGRAVVGVGTGPGLSNYALGQKGGAVSATLTTPQMPAHIHPVNVVLTPNASDSGSNPTPGGGVFASPSDGNPAFASAPSGVFTQPFQGNLTTSSVGSGLPFSTQHPVLALNYIVCMYGVYPARN